MIRIGIVGIGFMGMTHFEAATKIKDSKITGSKLKSGKVTAIAVRNPKKRSGDWSMIQGNFGPPGRKMDLSPIKVYEDYHDLLADPEIDLVDICLPTDLHEKVGLESIKAGKATLVEKPIAIDLKGANRMVRAAQKAGLPLMVGQVLPFAPEYRFVADTIKSQKYGRLLAAHFRRVITPPTWSDDISDFRRLGGWGIDLHIHDNHFISLVCGTPRSVFSRGLLQDGFVNHVHTQYVYDSDQAISCVSGGIAAKGLQFGHAFEIYLERATILFDFATLGGQPTLSRPLTLITQDGKARTPTLKAGADWCSGFTAELQAAVDTLSKGQMAEALSGDLACDALKVCYAEAKSIKTGQPAAVK